VQSDPNTTFLVIALCKVITFFTCRLLIMPTFLRCLSSVLSQFSHKENYFSRLSPGRVRPSPSDATGAINICTK